MLKNKKYIVTIVLIILLTSGLAFALLKDRGINNSGSAGGQGKSESINLDPPSADDKQRVADNKQKIVSKQNNSFSPKTNGDGKSKVKPVITYAGQYGSNIEASAYIPGTVEDDGECTASLSKNGVPTKTVSTKAVSNVSTMNCPTMTFNVNELGGKGSWTLVVSYSSGKSSGSSDPKEVEVL